MESVISRRAVLKGAGAALVGAAAIAPHRASSTEHGESWDLEADVVVVGLGSAGACAAIAAREAEARVLVLEGAAAGGGSSRLSGGELYLGGGTALQKKLDYEDSSEEMFKYLMASSGPGADEEKMRLYCERSPEHYDWLVEQGLQFKAAFYPEHHDPPGDEGLRYGGSEGTSPFNRIAKPAPRSHIVREPGLAGGALMDTLIARLKKVGAEVLEETRCETLVADANDRVLGVVARSKGGSRKIRAKRGVILSTGGFLFNQQMAKLYAPQLAKCTPIGARSEDGSGILMGMGLGAAAIHMDAGFAGLALHPPEEIIGGILVDRKGQRFINEDCYLGRVGEYALWRADGDVYLILDASISASPVLGDDELVATAGSIEELHEVLGLPALAQTLEFYNTHARRGQDPLLGKQPQFLRPLEKLPLRAYHYKVGESYYPAFTLGGLWTRPTGEVRRPDGSTITGLYAAGRTASGVPARGYNSGTSIGDATFFGRLAGEAAARA
jgi:3-oxo-5alpha-steroid 4-dehydrogenase